MIKSKYDNNEYFTQITDNFKTMIIKKISFYFTRVLFLVLGIIIFAPILTGNPATVADAAWTPVVPTPNHPEYPAAHSCTTASIATVLERYFGTNLIDFSIDSTVAGLTQPVRSYHNTDDMVRDLSLARIYGGMHYRTSTRDGIQLGVRVAKWVTTNYFRAKKKKSHD